MLRQPKFKTTSAQGHIAGGQPTPRPPAFAYLFLFVLGLVAAATIKTGRDSLIAANQREVVRLTSPDRRLDAVFVQPKLTLFGKGAALYIVPRGEGVPGWGPVVHGDHFRPVPVLTWKNPQLLEIRYRWGCVDRFSNAWHSYDVAGGRLYVEIVLRPARNFTCLDQFRAPTARIDQPGRALQAAAAVLR